MRPVPFHERNAALELGPGLGPDGANHWDVLSAETEERVQGSFPPSQRLDELDTEGILALGGRLGEMVAESATFLHWIGESPLIPRISERANLQPLDQAVKEHLGALEEVCRRPRGHLRREIDRLPVARARRTPASAATYLASHTEDWERPTLRSVLPKRVLALIQEDQWDIYENRVVVRLVDHLRFYLDRRLDELRLLARILEQVGDHSSALSGATYWRRRQRISKLWGSAAEANEGYRLVEKTLAETAHLRQRVAALMDLPLYREVPRNAAVEHTLGQTNVFASDARYRRVALLWGEWAKHRRARGESSAEAQDKLQRICRSFGDFCFLLVVRALEQLAYEPLDLDTPLRRQSRCELNGPHGAVQLEWPEDGTIRIDGGIALRIVPVPASLHASLDEEELLAQIREMEDAAASGSLTLILYPGLSSDRSQRLGAEARRRLRSLGNDLGGAGARRLGMLPVSPWDIASVERVARALRWVMLGPRLLAYPPEIPPPPKSIAPGLWSRWMECEPGGKCQVLRRPGAQDAARLDEERQRLRREQDEVQARLDGLPKRELDDKRSLADRNRQKTQITHDLAHMKQRLEEMERFCQPLEEAFRAIDALARCPICTADGASSERDFEAMHHGTFRRTCRGCKTRWGTQICGHCSQKYPFLSVDFAGVQPGGRGSAGWADECLGSDVLAVPCVHSEFICPACGQLPCARCASDTA